MPHLVSNLFEKAYTPYTARLAPKHLWSRPALGKYSNVKLYNRLWDMDLHFHSNRTSSTKGFKIGCWPNMEGHMAFHWKMGLPEPQALLHLCCWMRLGCVQLLVVHHGWILQTEKPPQITRVRHPEGIGMGIDQAKGWRWGLLWRGRRRERRRRRRSCRWRCWWWRRRGRWVKMIAQTLEDFTYKYDSIFVPKGLI